MSNTNKSLIILLGITAAAAGGYAAYKIYTKKKSEKVSEISAGGTIEEIVSDTEKETEEADMPEKFIFADNIAKMPDPVEIERTEYATKAAVYSNESGEMDVESSEDEEDFEAFKVSKEYDAYQKKNKNKIIVLPEDDIDYTWNREVGNDPENPDVCYDEEELYYFTEDEVLTDEDGNVIDEEQYLGVKPRQFGWFANDKEDIYIRNNPLERDFRVNKVFACKEAYFPE